MKVLSQIYYYLNYYTELLGDRNANEAIKNRLEQFTSMGDSNDLRKKYLGQIDDDDWFNESNSNTGDCRDEDPEGAQFEWEQRKIVSERVRHFQKAKYHRHHVRRSKAQRRT
ncbi:MAG: hypothetical protein ACKOAV_09995 [Bacteroidota bacterium]